MAYINPGITPDMMGFQSLDAMGQNPAMDPKMAMMLSQFGKIMQGPQKKKGMSPQHMAAVSQMQNAMMGGRRG